MENDVSTEWTCIMYDDDGEVIGIFPCGEWVSLTGCSGWVTCEIWSRSEDQGRAVANDPMVMF